MKETKHINLAGYAYIIDEDAAEQLAQYLKEIESRLNSSDSKEEIMLDIETRIAELFKQHLDYSHTEVVNMLVTKDIMQQLGSPELITENADDKGNADINTEADTDVKNNENERLAAAATNKRKLYRDMNDKRVAGVCGGLATYIGIDSVWIRLLLAIGICFYGSGLLLYLLLWFAMPAANTTARKLEQQGITPSAENIRLEVERQKEEAVKHPEVQHEKGNSILSGCLIASAILIVTPVIIAIVLSVIFYCQYYKYI